MKVNANISNANKGVKKIEATSGKVTGGGMLRVRDLSAQDRTAFFAMLERTKYRNLLDATKRQRDKDRWLTVIHSLLVIMFDSVLYFEPLTEDNPCRSHLFEVDLTFGYNESELESLFRMLIPYMTDLQLVFDGDDYRSWGYSIRRGELKRSTGIMVYSPLGALTDAETELILDALDTYRAAYPARKATVDALLRRLLD